MAHVNHFIQQLTQAVDDFDDPHPAIESGVRCLTRDELQLIYQRMRDDYCDVSRPVRVEWPLGSRILVYNALYNTIESRSEERPLLREQGYPTITAGRPVSSKFPFVIDHNFNAGPNPYSDPPDPVEGYPESRARVCSEDCWVLMGRLPASEVGSHEVAIYATTVNPFNWDPDAELQYYGGRVAFTYYVMEGNTTIPQQIWRNPVDENQMLSSYPLEVRVYGVCWLQEHFELELKTEAEVQQLDDDEWTRWVGVIASSMIDMYIGQEDNLGVEDDNPGVEEA